AAHTNSNQLIKGVLDGSSRGVFQGQIHIAPDAQQTEGYQLHRALLLSDNAEVDCKPELEIFADDVKCSHGATSGDLDKEQLFYMQTRGIALNDAKQILIEAYLNEALQKVENEQLREWLKEIL
ncbi:MAG: SufD family Fe-S cluster assembly protein, partial [Alphaproteobacteria bacterium]|nr:SufD family Fe-S cluster assembly protein [Alphaproteobacteria bacterium]MDY4689685.1 SufD family Fe-S cluster assembly protein [Alphaproteobacteria bacterium]